MTLGERIKVLPGYEMATKKQTRVDEFTGAAGTIIEIALPDVLVQLDDGREAWLGCTRLGGVTMPWAVRS